jgi:hypothetical protein
MGKNGRDGMPGVPGQKGKLEQWLQWDRSSQVGRRKRHIKESFSPNVFQFRWRFFLLMFQSS